jgi:hypothetical protein
LRAELQLGHNYIGTEHLLLGLIRDDCTGARVLVALGADLPTVREHVTRLLSEPGRQPARARGWKGDHRDTIGVVVPVVRLLARVVTDTGAVPPGHTSWSTYSAATGSRGLTARLLPG